MNTKKIICILFSTLFLVIAFAGCTSDAGGNFTKAIVDWKPENKNYPDRELLEHTDANFADALGFNVVEYPSGTNVTPQKFYTIGDWFGQIEYKVNEHIYVLRMAYIEERSPLAQSYLEGHAYKAEELNIDGIEVSIKSSSDGCVLITWENGVYQYLIHSSKAQGRPDNEEITRFVSGLRCADA